MRSIFFLMCLVLFPMVAQGQDMRELPKGESCGPYEKTIKDEDGKPVLCRALPLKLQGYGFVSPGDSCGPYSKPTQDQHGKETLCAPSGSPGYEFEVSLDGVLLWKGEMGKDETDVEFKLAKQHETGKGSIVLMLRQLVEPYSAGPPRVFFGERKVIGLKEYHDADGEPLIQMPIVETRGYSFTPSEKLLDISLFDTNRAYRVVVNYKGSQRSAE